MYPEQVIWDLPDEPGGNVQHIAEHGLSVKDVEAVLFDANSDTVVSNSTGEWIPFGRTPDGRYIAVVWQEVAEDVIRPLTAFEAQEPWRNS